MHLEGLIPLLDLLSQHQVSHLRLKCLLHPDNPKQIDPKFGGDKQFRKVIQHLKIKLPHMGLILEAPYPHIQSGIPLCFNAKQGFFFQTKNQALPILPRDYLDILSHMKNSLHQTQLMPHEIKQFEKLIHIYELAFIKTKHPNLDLFLNLNLWFSASPARQKLIKNYLSHLPKDHYEAFFPKSRLDEWQLKEPNLITLD